MQSVRDCCIPMTLVLKQLEHVCVVSAAAASSLCVGKPGAMPSLPDRASVDELLQQQQ